MSRLDIQPPAPGDSQALVETLRRFVEEFDGRVSFGTPQDPLAEDGTTLAGAAAANHPGTLQNIEGAWVEYDVTALDTATTLYHNLGQKVVSATGSPNVRWLLMGFQHDGTTADPDATLSCNYQTGDTVTADSIQLRFYATGTRAVGVANPLRVTLFFMRATR